MYFKEIILQDTLYPAPGVNRRQINPGTHQWLTGPAGGQNVIALSLLRLLWHIPVGHL